jgi:hypothetical protein
MKKHYNPKCVNNTYRRGSLLEEKFKSRMTKEAKSTVIIPSIYTSDSKHPKKGKCQLLPFEPLTYKKIPGNNKANQIKYIIKMVYTHDKKSHYLDYR